MVEIKAGGQLEKLQGQKLKEIRINVSENSRRRFELWINEDSLSYVTLDELLDLKDEINNALESILK